MPNTYTIPAAHNQRKHMAHKCAFGPRGRFCIYVSFIGWLRGTREFRLACFNYVYMVQICYVVRNIVMTVSHL